MTPPSTIKNNKAAAGSQRRTGITVAWNIDADTPARLSTPYEQPGQLLSSVLQWLGIGAVLLIGMAVLGA